MAFARLFQSGSTGIDRYTIIYKHSSGAQRETHGRADVG
jgi:hypothetical protein